MATIEFTARRTVFALAIAIATIATPVVAAVAGSPHTVVPRVLAECTTSGEPGDAELECEPNTVENIGGAPSEMQLTEENPGVGSPMHRG